MRVLDLDDLQEHLWSLPDQPDAIPYRTSYYDRAWGFCLTDRQRRELVPGAYEVHIDSDLVPEGSWSWARSSCPGRPTRRCCSPPISATPRWPTTSCPGPMVVAQLADLLRRRADPPRFTYRCFSLPETIGAISYLSRFGQRLRERLVAGFVVTCIGDPGRFTYKLSRQGDTLADRAALHVLEPRGEPTSRRLLPTLQR